MQYAMCNMIVFVFLNSLVVVLCINPLRYKLYEEKSTPEMVCNVAADAKLDLEFGQEARKEIQFEYGKIEDSNQDLFELSSDGILSTKGRIDRDKICPGMENCVVKLEIALKPGKYFDLIEVEITIIDINDNAPVFPSKIVNKVMPENSHIGTSLSIPPAHDPDSPANGIHEYRIVSETSLFELQRNKQFDGSTGLYLILRSDLDREKQDSYQIRIVAVDAGQESKTGELTVNLTVLDQNDNKPVFMEPAYEVNVKESTPVNHTVVQVHATDRDAGLNGQVEYQFSPRTQSIHGNLFGLNNKTGEIYLKSQVDFEKEHRYPLVILATDMGVVKGASQALVTVHVIDENDNAPSISVNTLTKYNRARVSESAPSNTFIAYVSVHDKDSGIGGMFDCRLGNTLDKFKIKHMTTEASGAKKYQLVTNGVIDREEHYKFDLEFECSDKGKPRRVATALIQVLVADENDFVPKFSKNLYTVSIKENNHIGDTILNVSASDKDEGLNGEVQYYLVDESLSDIRVNPKTGVITAAVIFDREQKTKIAFDLIATDQGKPPKSSTAAVEINIEDVNDETPVFTSQGYVFGVAENEPIDTAVGRVEAKDGDSTLNSQLYYTLGKSKSGNDAFRIEGDTGIIKTKMFLDREESAVHHLVVVATNSQSPHPSSSASVTIYIADKNDNTPVIEYPKAPNNTIYVSSKTPVDYPFQKIIARDKDGGKNARLVYKIIQGNEKTYFSLKENTGYLSFAKDFSTTKHAIFGLTIQVSDCGENRKRTDTNLIVFVNDSIPFELPSRSTALLSDTNLLIVVCVTAVAGTIILTLSFAMVIVCCRERQKERFVFPVF